MSDTAPSTSSLHDWQTQAIAWLRAKAAEQAQINERYPQHAAAYPSWVERVHHTERLADDLEREMTTGANAREGQGT